MKKPGVTNNSNLGMALVEMMIAITISLLLLSGIVQVFLGTKQTYRLGEQIALLQENGRFGLDLVSRDIRMVGFQGCADPETIPASVIALNAPTNYYALTGLRGSKNTSGGWDPALPSELPTTVTDIYGNTHTMANLPVAGSDLIIVQHAGSMATPLAANHNGGSTPLTISANPNGFAANNILMLSDCENAEIFRATAVNDTGTAFEIGHALTGNTLDTFSKSYGTNAQLMHFVSNIYFVAPSMRRDGTTRKNKKGDTINALYRVDADGILYELLEGVDNLQALYAERLSNNNIRYMSADNSSLDMQQVDSVKIGLLMSTVEAVTETDDDRDYLVAGTTIKPAGNSGLTYPIDHRIRKVFSATVNLRNRR